jgi:hypothetical protein
MLEDNNDVRVVRARRVAREKNSFDELAKGLATGTLTRVQALKLLGGAVLGAMLVPLFPERASADHSDEDGCQGLSKPCGSTCCGVAEECCDGVVCCDPGKDCCAGACCEVGKVCVGGYCACAPGTTECGSDCCDPATEICGEDGRCHNQFCESCQAEGGNCCQSVEGGYLISEACCYPGERSCTRSGEGCICCPAGTRCPDRDLGEAFVCISA